MKKLLFGIILGSLVLSGCNSKNEEDSTPGTTSIEVEGEKEELTDQTLINKSIEKYGEAVSYIEKTNFDMKEGEDASSIKTIMTIADDGNAKFEIDNNDKVTTLYETSDKSYIVKDGKLSETESQNIASNATYGDILKMTKDLHDGKIKQEEDKFYLTYDLANKENREALLGSNLKDAVDKLEDIKGTLVLTYSKEYLLTDAKVEGTAKDEGKEIGFEGTAHFENVDNVDKIELPE